MIDFTSTRPETPEDVKGSLHLLAALIAFHVRAASMSPTNQEKRRCRNETFEARRGIEYLFGPDSKFPDHADLIGADADSLRRSLLGDHELLERSPFNHRDRRVLKTRHFWWTLETQATN